MEVFLNFLSLVYSTAYCLMPSPLTSVWITMVFSIVHDLFLLEDNLCYISVVLVNYKSCSSYFVHCFFFFVCTKKALLKHLILS